VQSPADPAPLSSPAQKWALKPAMADRITLVASLLLFGLFLAAKAIGLA
jgi:hypothetical protein